MSISRSMEPQQVAGEQLELFTALMVPAYHDVPGADGNSSGTFEEQQVPPVMYKPRALTQDLMERVASLENLEQAVRKVRSNKGSPAVDGMTTGQLKGWFASNWRELQSQLLSGLYGPSEVRGVEIPKPGGGVRQLGIPTVLDRVVQQALLQRLEPLLDPTFSENSFGFRPRRNAHQALKQACGYVKEGRCIVVDMDLEKFFDRVNHDILMARLGRHISDKQVLRLVLRFLEAGMMQAGVCIERHEGTPQGGPLSPLLANLLLDDLDKELERRGHTFCRYADDCNIYVRSMKAGERVLASVTQFLEKKLKLRVNRKKSAVAFIEQRKFLGYRLRRGGKLGIAPQSLERAKDRIREITRRNRGDVTFEQMVGELNNFLSGWVLYFRDAECKSHLKELSTWIRRKLRCVKLKRLKRAKTIAKFLRKNGVSKDEAWKLAASGKGWWRLAKTIQAHMAMDCQWFTKQELIDPVRKYQTLKT